ncbi:Putative peptidoglycan binding domain-containing protein [Sedimentitalea nanhaiensis]|uniref:Putative peptidoglycan binding domain-containing protein n=2 Tax=Sedimentitalea nanhaiensis TaxID=999627 RepID=A0A1I6YE01_9RHOB|nr:Putative peptidoglycan binding domain-containing protein [Sedimentitalea nanhaiensis]
MMTRVFALLVWALAGLTGTASAQQGNETGVWVQIEAHPSLTTAQQRAQDYAARLADVNGFSLGGSWYGILLGPYLRDDAERVLRTYRADRLIPRDSFIAYSRNLGAQYWPGGANVLNRGVIAAPQPAAPTVAAQTAEPVTPADETPAEARRGERLLSAGQRKDLQTALRAAGFYNAAIDGAFGAGTRRSMADWQLASGYEPTGVLTTLQRQALMDRYNAPLISTGMRRVHDVGAGIEIDLPMAEVGFARYEPPFAHYDATGDLGVRLLLISQPGTRATLYGLYDIMQTLEIVPLDGPRNRGKDRFTLEGRGKGMVSYTEAALADGQIKGFTLIWPEGDEARRLRVLDAMQASFTRTDAVLDPATGDSAQSVDLLSGLQVRKPRLTRSGFYVDNRGAVVTTADAIEGCARITLDDEYPAQVAVSDAGLGVAVLRPTQALAPMSVARFRRDKGRLQSPVTVSGFSYGGVLGGPTLTHGTLADVKGLAGESELTRLALNALPGDAGGPVIDAAGGVLGMLLPARNPNRDLPQDVSLSADAGAIRAVLDRAGLQAADSDQTDSLAPGDLNRVAFGMTVLVSCWD